MNIFSRTKARHQVDEAQIKVTNWKLACGALFLLCVLQAVGFIVYPKLIKIHHPPDTSKSMLTALNEIPPAQVQGFSFMILQQLNNLKDDGKYTAENQLTRLRCFMTEDYFYLKLRTARNASLSFNDRNRAMSVYTAIPPNPYEQVTILTPTSWNVKLYTTITESAGGELIKDNVPFLYNLQVVADNSDPSCNEYGLKLAGENDVPRRIRTEIN
ncbi:DUF2895 family protein [Photobacterium sp. GB-72]|uniref:DUF2895 family protein n=1 Tax=Photobacterium sp. GB-72 TaxID=2022105 RepID=UPI000D48DBB3|nr:DUF2895 family protein [Photobacterium sp. GB-72]PSV28062.1 hypothetical protein C9J40_19475 [Photobacterium sp. GB-72]